MGLSMDLSDKDNYLVNERLPPKVGETHREGDEQMLSIQSEHGFLLVQSRMGYIKGCLVVLLPVTR
jgi:hypothetical protein